MTAIEEALQKKINERERKVTAFVTVPRGATFLELRDLDYEIARLRFLLQQEQQAARLLLARPLVSQRSRENVHRTTDGFLFHISEMAKHFANVIWFRSQASQVSSRS